MIDRAHRPRVLVLKPVPVIDGSDQVCRENVIAGQFVLLEHCPVVQVPPKGVLKRPVPPPVIAFWGVTKK